MVKHIILWQLKDELSDDEKIIDIIVAKNNNGETGTVSLRFDK